MRTVLLIGLSMLLIHGQAQDTARVQRPRPESSERKPNVLAGLLRGPYLQMASATGMMVRWRTDALTRSVVAFGLSADDLSMTAEDSALSFEHKVQITGLKAGTRYYYSIGGGAGDTLQKGPDNFFTTLPVSGEKGNYRIGIFGDCGNNSINQRNVRDQFLKYLGDKPMNACILLGDNAYSSGTDPEYQHKFFNIYKDDLLKKYPVFPSPGNHDYNDFYRFKATAQATHDVAYFKNFSMPASGESGGIPSGNPAFYSFDVGNVHFLSLDSYGKEDNDSRMSDTLGAQVQWVKKDLEAYKNKKGYWVVAYWHHPPYTMGSHNSDKETELISIRENFIRILERYGVDLVLCGHSHVYERSKMMNGHFGMEASFDSAKHNLSQSSGLNDGSAGSCPYIKDASADRGTVYVVTGSAGAQGGQQATYPHDAMYYSYNTLGGASVLEVEGNKLELKFIAADGNIRDRFTMMKDVNKRETIRVRPGMPVTLTASFTGEYTWNKSKEMSGRLTVRPPRGRTFYEVKDKYGCLKDVFEVIVSN